MKIEIWSDVVCPFCYIGKRNLELALAEFEGRDDVEIEWRSFQLDPGLEAPQGLSPVAYLAERKGQSLAWSQQAHAQVSASAREVGLEMRFDRAVVANTLDAHRLLKMAMQAGKGLAAQERLFRAYFTEGVNVADHGALVQLGVELGLDGGAVAAMLASDEGAAEVREDQAEAYGLGAQGVPFFVLDRRLGVVGAQPPAHLLQALRKSAESM